MIIAPFILNNLLLFLRYAGLYSILSSSARDFDVRQPAACAQSAHGSLRPHHHLTTWAPRRRALLRIVLSELLPEVANLLLKRANRACCTHARLRRVAATVALIFGV